MSIFTKALREESETIRFDNLFTQDIEKEQEFDLIFAAEQDDEDLKTIAGNAIMKEDGTEIKTNIPDCVTVNEDGEVVDKDDNEEEEGEDISSNDVDGDGTDDDLEAADSQQPGPSVVVNVDADDVNINAADDKTSFGEDGDVTVNANVANITPIPASAEPAPVPVSHVAPSVTTEPAPAPDDSEEEELIPAADAEEPKTVEVDTVDVQVPEEEIAPIENEELSTDDENDEPTSEGVEELISADMLDDIMSSPTSMDNQPVDPSTEVVFSDNPDIEVKDEELGEMSLIEEDMGDITLGDAPQEDSEIEEVEEPVHTDTSAYAAIEKEENLDGDEAMNTVDDLVIDPIGEGFEDEEMKSEELGIIDLEGMEPSLTAGDLEGMFMCNDDDPSKKKPAGKIDESYIPLFEEDESNESDDSDDESGEDIKDEGCCKEMSLIEEDEGFSDEEMGDDDTSDLEGYDDLEEIEEADIEAVKNDDNLEAASAPESSFEDNLEEIDSKELENILNTAPEDEVKEELEIEPVQIDDVNFTDSVKEAEEIEAVKNDDNLEPAGEKFEDDLEEITDSDVETIMNDAPEDEVKEELDIDPVKPSDIPMNDGSVTEGYIELLGEESAEIINGKDIAENDPLSPIGPSEIIPDEINAPEEDLDYDKVVAEPMKEDYEEDLAMISTEDDFANKENDGLDHTPESEEPGSFEELLDDEAAAIVEAEE